VHAFDDEASEERFVVERVKALLKAGTPAKEVAVLYRFNSQSARLEAAFSKAGIPYQVSDSERFFERAEVKQVLAALWEAGRRDPEALGLALLDDVLASLGHDRDLAPSGAGRARERWEAVSALVTTIEELPGSATLAAKYVLEEMRLRAKESHSPTPNSVTLCTLHKAKGLEWEAVFMVNLTEGSLPSSYASTDAMVAEERRLAYVGVTRAKRVLHLTFSRTSSRGWASKPSRFLTAFGLTSAKPTTRRPRTKAARPRATTCRDCGNALTAAMGAVGLCASCLPSVANDLADRISSWRRAKATDARVTVEEVLSDDLLWRIVLARPTKLGEIVALEGFTESGASSSGRAIVALCKEAAPAAQHRASTSGGPAKPSTAKPSTAGRAAPARRSSQPPKQ
jgi:DNA helicase-2/ATP-dependent DNA helicase PcrA